MAATDTMQGLEQNWRRVKPQSVHATHILTSCCAMQNKRQMGSKSGGFAENRRAGHKPIGQQIPKPVHRIRHQQNGQCKRDNPAPHHNSPLAVCLSQQTGSTELITTAAFTTANSATQSVLTSRSSSTILQLQYGPHAMGSTLLSSLVSDSKG